jgi:hypothetical protein
VNLEDLLQGRLLRNIRDFTATVRAAWFLISAVLTAALVAYAFLRRNLVGPTAAVMIILAVAGWWVTVLACAYYTKNVNNPPFYEILELDGVLVVESSGHHHRYRYTRRQKVRATRNDLRLIEMRAHWSGSSNAWPRVESLVGDHVLLDGKYEEEDGRVHRWVYPRRPLRKGEELRVGIRQSHEDEVRPQLPYFREGGGRYKTRKLTITTRFPIADDPQTLGAVVGRVWDISRAIDKGHVVDTVGFDREVDREQGTVDYIVRVDRPKLYHSYGIQWEWPARPYEVSPTSDSEGSRVEKGGAAVGGD